MCPHAVTLFSAAGCQTCSAGMASTRNARSNAGLCGESKGTRSVGLSESVRVPAAAALCTIAANPASAASAEASPETTTVTYPARSSSENAASVGENRTHAGQCLPVKYRPTTLLSNASAAATGSPRAFSRSSSTIISSSVTRSSHAFPPAPNAGASPWW